MKILVIGGMGYIGAHVVVELIRAGHKVTVYDDLSTGQPNNAQLESTLIKADILDYRKLCGTLAYERFDAVIHLAAKKAVAESMINPDYYARNNISGSLGLLSAMAANGVKKLIFSSSAAVYGMPKDDKPLTEESPVDPINFYGFTKLEIERAMAWYDKLKDIKFVALRYFNAVGYDAAGRVKGLEKNPQNLLPAIMESMTGRREGLEVFGDDYPTPDGTCIRDYIHCTDLAIAHVKALGLKESATLNLGTNKGTSVLEMIKAVEEITGKKVPYKVVGRRSGDPAFLVASPAKAAKVLGWKAEHSSLQNIVRTTWDRYQSPDAE